MNFGKRWTPDDLDEATYKTARKSKYNAQRIVIDCITFHSKKEAKFYKELKLDPDVKFFLRQVPFDLPGGTSYRADFLIFLKDGSYKVVDVKGFSTQVYRLKKKQVEAIYPVKIEEV